MKKLTTLIALFIMSTAGVFSQSLQVTSDTVHLTGPANALMVATARVTNIGGGTINVKVRRTQVDTASGHSSYFCWTGTCYPFTVNESPNDIIMNPGDTDTTLQADLNPRNFDGTSIVTYCFYDKDNVSDSACITFTYEAMVVGIRELAGLKYLSDPFPNPADMYSKLNYVITKGKEAKLQISNVLGATVREINLAEKQGTVLIPTADLKSGIYVCSILIDGKTAGSKKLLVNHR